jgi:hypothetical protein
MNFFGTEKVQRRRIESLRPLKPGVASVTAPANPKRPLSYAAKPLERVGGNAFHSGSGVGGNTYPTPETP